MTSAPLEDARRAFVLAEFRCAITKAKLTQLDLEAVALALHHNLVTPEQAVQYFWDSDAVQFLGILMEGEPHVRP
jgi:hypothetical protein